MSLLASSITRRILHLSPAEKQGCGERIVDILGGDSTRQVTDLPTRRGTADGGIDGRVRVIAHGIEANAGFAIRISNQPFSRCELGCLFLDMDREGLTVGLIITAQGLAPDTQSEIRRLNRKYGLQFVHLLLEDLVRGEINTEDCRLLDQTIVERLRDQLRQYAEEA
jgi:hypothetical protein